MEEVILNHNITYDIEARTRILPHAPLSTKLGGSATEIRWLKARARRGNLKDLLDFRGRLVRKKSESRQNGQSRPDQFGLVRKLYWDNASLWGGLYRAGFPSLGCRR